MLKDIEHELSDTINNTYSHLVPEYSEETDKLLTQRVSLDMLLNIPETPEIVDERPQLEPFPCEFNLPESEDGEEVEEDEDEPKPEPESARLPELLAELYVKFGAISPAEAAQQLALGFTPDLAGMKARRRELLKKQLHMDTHIPHPNSKAFQIKKLFTELYVEPDDAEVDDVLAGKLELESARDFVNTARAMRSLRRESKRPKDETDDSDEEGKNFNIRGPVLNPEHSPKVLTDLPHSVQLDTMYLHATMGDRAFMPATLTDCIKAAPQELVNFGNFTELPQEWLERNLRSLSKGLLQYRASIETHLTRAELASFDQRFLRIFAAETFKEALLQKLYTEEAFLTNTGTKARQTELASEHEAMQQLKGPDFKPRTLEELAEGHAVKHALRLKQEREHLKPKTPLQFTAMDEFHFSQVSDQGPLQAVTPLSVQQEYAEHRTARAKLHAKEASLLDAQKTVAALQQLVRQQKYRKRLVDPAAVEAFLKQREQTLA